MAAKSQIVTGDYADEYIRFLQLQLGGDRNFCYICVDVKSGMAAVVDPGFRAGWLSAAAAERGLKISCILITHGHSDHIAQAGRLADITGAPVYAGERERVPGSLVLTDGQRLNLGTRPITAFHTPGHSPGHLCYLFENRLMTGDLLFCGKVGGTGPGFPGSAAEEEWASLKRIASLPEETLVYPGHDYYGGDGRMPHSTIGCEKRNNPFLLCGSFEAFTHLKQNWDSYKREHGIR